jgi:16S rRNA (cytidine1402-2'-O)-methyltransferase
LSTLYVVATPIGNLEDVTLRALRVLGEVETIAAEDTRVTGRLLARHGLKKKMLSYRAPVEERALPRVLQALADGDVALVTDAGTPTLSDPGQKLVDAAWNEGHTVVPLPGPSAVTGALAAAGYGGPGFCFAGYLPRKPGELRRFFESLREAERPTIVFESPYRVRRALSILAEVLPERHVAVAREMTKVHEQILRGTAADVLSELGEPVRGEITLVLSHGQRLS